MPADAESLAAEIASQLENSAAAAERVEPLLEQIVARFGCASGTIHLVDATAGLLKLKAAHGIPDFVLPKIETIPVGKGMAGIAAERRAPVQVCNLQTDDSGVVRPAARDTKMEGSIAAPMIDSRGVLRGTVGVAKPVAYDFTAYECALLLDIGRQIADRLLHDAS